MSDLDRIFKAVLPDNLYMSHYELAQRYGHSPQEWRQYLKDNEPFITGETAAIAEANARKALNALGQGATTQEVSAIKALLEKSKLINDAQKQQQHVLLTFMPSKEEQAKQPTIQALTKHIELLESYIYFVQRVKPFNPEHHTFEWFRKMKGENPTK